jgi:putative transcriptional regulator
LAIIVNLDVMMAKRKISLNELSDRVGITKANLSILKTGKAKAIRFSTLNAICIELNCQPGDILEYFLANSPDDKEEDSASRQDDKSQDDEE